MLTGRTFRVREKYSSSSSSPADALRGLVGRHRNLGASHTNTTTCIITTQPNPTNTHNNNTTTRKVNRKYSPERIIYLVLRCYPPPSLPHITPTDHLTRVIRRTHRPLALVYSPLQSSPYHHNTARSLPFQEDDHHKLEQASRVNLRCLPACLPG